MPPFPQVSVEAEEVVYPHADRDACMMSVWCHGNTCLVRRGDHVVASGIERIPGAAGRNRLRWVLFERGHDGWQARQREPSHGSREPSPLGVLADGRVFLSVNPTCDPRAVFGPTRPALLEFAMRDLSLSPREILPVWREGAGFNQHSYRTFVTDGENGEMILFQNMGVPAEGPSDTHAEWTFRDRYGQWAYQGRLVWPWADRAVPPQPLRLCYPVITLVNRAVYFLGVSDIIEPKPEWREFRTTHTFDFRRLFFTWCPDIATGRFEKWIEIADLEETAGYMNALDIRVDSQGEVHLLWHEMACDPGVRDRFFPEFKQSLAIKYAVLHEGKVRLRKTLVIGGPEYDGSEEPCWGRFHTTADGRLFVFCTLGHRTSDDPKAASARILEIYADGNVSEPVPVPLKVPLMMFFTATPRGGSRPSDILDVLGVPGWTSGVTRYARIRIAPENRRAGFQPRVTSP